MSSDLATLFTGRTFEIKVFPFSFSEYMRYFGYSDKYAAVDKYMIEGGIAGSNLYKYQYEGVRIGCSLDCRKAEQA